MAASDVFSPAPEIVTKAELDQRRKEREAPVIRPSLEPDGHVAHTVKSCTIEANERRIGHLENRLHTVRECAERDHSFARLHGRAKVDFGMCD